MSAPIAFTLDGREVAAGTGGTIWQVARREGIEICHLGFTPEPGYRAATGLGPPELTPDRVPESSHLAAVRAQLVPQALSPLNEVSG